MRSPRADEEPHWGDALIEFSDKEPRGGGGRFYRVDDTEELPGDAILYCDGASIYIWARTSIFGRVTSIYWRVTSLYIWARHEINAPKYRRDKSMSYERDKRDI